MPEPKINIKDTHQPVEICISSQFREPFVRTFGVDANLGVHLSQLLASDDVLIAQDTNPMQIPQRLGQ